MKLTPFFDSITTTKGKHLVIDAGHISITSELASKEAIQDIHSKRNKKYTAADYERLASMMYDRLTVRLEAAQVGNLAYCHGTCAHANFTTSM